jgi:hypothetical protein
VAKSLGKKRIKLLEVVLLLFQPGVGTVTCIASKNDQIVQGDVDGLLNVWDLKARTSKNIHTGRGWIKKMRFAPGKGNLKLLILYSDGIDIVDLKKVQLNADIVDLKKVQLNVARNQDVAVVNKLHTF